ncbi:hypothetical protein FBU30_003469 [Linnemannia zychae]|nr:hypothetical protein FBU30_003469 [Linnemannia zychae]
MTTVGTLSSDLGPGNNNLSQPSMDLPAASNNTVPLIVTTAADDDKNVLARANDNPMNYLQPVSKLDMEPNPFEQSFSDITPEKSAPPSGNSAPAPEPPKPTLPPIESMSGRLAPNNEQFGWDTQSLRMGPLSPSMLEGPQDPIPVASYPTTTAAISTIYTSGAPLAENGYSYVGTIAPPSGPIQTAEPYPSAIYNQAGQAPRQAQPFPHINGQAPINDRYIPPQGISQPDNIHGYNNMQNLTQAQAAAQREMWIKRESIDANGYFPGPQQQPQQHNPGQNGQNAVGMVSTQNRDSHPSRLKSEDNSDDSQFSRQSSVSGDQRPGNNTKNNTTNVNKKRPATDEKMDEDEKRRNFLERNRQAALKCRQRKKQWLSNLQAKVEYLTTDNEHLQAQTAALRDEIIHLKALLLAHKDCPVAQANGVYAHTIGVAGSHNGGGMMAPNMQGQAGQQQQRGVAQRGGPIPQPPQQMQTGGTRIAISSAAGGPGVSTAATQGQALRY